MKEIFDALRDVFEIQADAEITMEANPGTVTKEICRHTGMWDQPDQFWTAVGR